MHGEDEQVNTIPNDARIRRGFIPSNERCEYCKGLGWVRKKYVLTQNVFHRCGACDGSGKKANIAGTQMAHSGADGSH